MGLRHTVQAFRTTDLDAFKQALSQTAVKHNGTFSTERTSDDYRTELRVGIGPKAIAVFHPRPIYSFFRDLSCALGGVPYMEARIQEGSHWDYSLHRGFELLDNFSTYPQYWEESDDPITSLARRGNPEMISLVFGVPIPEFDRYLKHWYSDWDEASEEYRFKLQGKAYPNDRSEYRNYEQLWDFLQCIGIHDPASGLHQERMTWQLSLPEEQTAIRRRTWWQQLLNK